MSIYIVFGILCFAVELFTVYTLLYYDNSIHLWYSDRDGYRPEIKLFMPSVTDLDYKNEDTSKYDIEKYEKEVVFPARDYFTQMRRLTQLVGDNIKNVVIGVPSLILFPIYCITWLSRKCENLTASTVIVTIAIAVISVPLIIFICYLIEKYNPQFKEFYITEEKLKKQFDDHKGYNQFPIPDKNALNNYIIEKHSNYIDGLENEIRRRTVWANIACVTVFLFIGVLVCVLR